MELQTAARYRLLDELRGLDLISMMLYHGIGGTWYVPCFLCMCR